MIRTSGARFAHELFNRIEVVAGDLANRPIGDDWDDWEVAARAEAINMIDAYGPGPILDRLLDALVHDRAYQIEDIDYLLDGADDSTYATLDRIGDVRDPCPGQRGRRSAAPAHQGDPREPRRQGDRHEPRGPGGPRPSALTHRSGPACV